MPPTRSNQAKPAFEGSTTPAETETVTVHIYAGSGTSGKQVAALSATVSGGKWSVAASSSLGDGKYTAQATQPSLLEDPEGKSRLAELKSPPRRQKSACRRSTRAPGVTKPTFRGSVSEPGTVTIHVHEGTTTSGKVVATFEGAASGEWAIVASSPLAEGTYTAVASELGVLGNGTGESESRTFEIDTHAPEVTLEGVPTPTNNTHPSFSGTATKRKRDREGLQRRDRHGLRVATAEGPV